MGQIRILLSDELMLIARLCWSASSGQLEKDWCMHNHITEFGQEGVHMLRHALESTYWILGLRLARAFGHLVVVSCPIGPIITKLDASSGQRATGGHTHMTSLSCLLARYSCFLQLRTSFCFIPSRLNRLQIIHAASCIHLIRLAISIFMARRMTCCANEQKSFCDVLAFCH
eukprot:6206045-Pleurochrysis_carterae.AAC.1